MSKSISIQKLRSLNSHSGKKCVNIIFKDKIQLCVVNEWVCIKLSRMPSYTTSSYTSTTTTKTSEGTTSRSMRAASAGADVCLSLLSRCNSIDENENVDENDDDDGNDQMMRGSPA